MSDEGDRPIARSSSRRRIEIASLLIALLSMFAAIVVPLYVYKIAVQNATLSLQFLTNQALINIGPRTDKGIKVIYNDNEIQSPWLVSVKLEKCW